MDLTKENVAKLLPNLAVTEVSDGIRIYSQEYVSFDGRLPMIGDIMRCALSLSLDPSQIKDECEYDEGADWGGMTGKESDIVTFDITFLWPPLERIKLCKQ